MVNSVKCIIFDFDNTLVRSHINFPAMKIEMTRLTKNFGLEFGKEEEIPHKYTAGNIIDKAEAFDKRNGTILVPQLWAVVEEFERKGMKNLTISDEVFAMLDSLKEASIDITLFTNNALNPTIEVLKRYNLFDYFSVVIARENVKEMKPDREGIDLILSEKNLQPHEALFVGDSWVDAKAANAAGVQFVLIRDEILKANKYNIKIWKHIQSLSELINLVNGE